MISRSGEHYTAGMEKRGPLLYPDGNEATAGTQGNSQRDRNLQCKNSAPERQGGEYKTKTERMHIDILGMFAVRVLERSHHMNTPTSPREGGTYHETGMSFVLDFESPRCKLKDSSRFQTELCYLK